MQADREVELEGEQRRGEKEEGGWKGKGKKRIKKEEAKRREERMLPLPYPHCVVYLLYSVFTTFWLTIEQKKL